VTVGVLKTAANGEAPVLVILLDEGETRQAAPMLARPTVERSGAVYQGFSWTGEASGEWRDPPGARR